MADRLDALEPLELLLGALALVAGTLEVAEDEFDGLEQAAGGLGLPDFAEAAPTQPLDEPVTGDWFRLTCDPLRHDEVLSRLAMRGNPPRARSLRARTDLDWTLFPRGPHAC